MQLALVVPGERAKRVARVRERTCERTAAEVSARTDVKHFPEPGEVLDRLGQVGHPLRDRHSDG